MRTGQRYRAAMQSTNNREGAVKHYIHPTRATPDPLVTDEPCIPGFEAIERAADASARSIMAEYYGGVLTTSNDDEVAR